MARPRYLLDEHISRAVQRQLLRRDFRIWEVSTAEEFQDQALYLPL
jgi:hypothetical protein